MVILVDSHTCSLYGVRSPREVQQLLRGGCKALAVVLGLYEVLPMSFRHAIHCLPRSTAYFGFALRYVTDCILIIGIIR